MNHLLFYLVFSLTALIEFPVIRALPRSEASDTEFHFLLLLFLVFFYYFYHITHNLLELSAALTDISLNVTVLIATSV